MIELTTRNNHKYIFEQCYRLAMLNENCFSVCEILWLAQFMIDNFGQSYWHHEYIEIDGGDEDSLAVLVRVRLGGSIIDLKVHPNWEEASILWTKNGEMAGSIDRLDFVVFREKSEVRLIDFLNDVCKKEGQDQAGLTLPIVK